MFKLNNCRWRMALAAIVALSIGFSSQAAEIDQIGTPESTAILTVGHVVKSAPGIECIKKNKMQTGLQTKLTSKKYSGVSGGITVRNFWLPLFSVKPVTSLLPDRWQWGLWC